MASSTKILGISGSMRKRSFNTALLRAAQELLPPEATLEIFDISKFPLFNQDMEATPPAGVVEFKLKIRGSDAILFAAPEYNFSVSALLKNAIEWANRPSKDNAWDGKPALITSASTGARGGARAQLHLRQILSDVNMFPLNKPQLLVGNAREAFDSDLRLIDETHRQTLKQLLAALVAWSAKVRS